VTLQILEQAGPEGVPAGFAELPAQIYADEPNWIPEEPESLTAAFSAENRWFDRGRARTFCIPGRARLAAFAPAVAGQDRRWGFFGYWESATDSDSDRAIFARAEQWLREQGAPRVYGPINFSTFGRYRLRLAAEKDAIPFPDEPFNPSSYPAALERLGYEVDSTYMTQMSPNSGARAARQAHRAVYERAIAAGYRIEAMRPELWLEHLDELYRLVNATFADNHAYTPIPKADFARLCGEAFIRRACPQTSVVAFAPDGEIAGVFLIFPHYGPLVVQGRGAKRVATSELCYERHMPLLQALGPVAAICKTVAVAPAHRGRGLMAALAFSLTARGDSLYASWYGALIRTHNLSERYSQPHAIGHRHYALYGKDLS
jgi:GNAT superfamily N-acetyltransferase